MSEDAEGTPFLRSGIGILTAIATLVAAIAGLLTALSQFGGGSSPPSSPPAAPGAATTVVMESDAQRELRSHIPSSILPTCGPPIDPEPGAVAAFNCKHRGIVGLQYNLFASSQEVETAYEVIKRRYGLAGSPTGDSCDAGNFEGSYRVASRDAGHLLCFVDPDVASIVWTDDSLDIVSFAWRTDRNLPALYEAWQKGVGPDE